MNTIGAVHVEDFRGVGSGVSEQVERNEQIHTHIHTLFAALELLKHRMKINIRNWLDVDRCRFKINSSRIRIRVEPWSNWRRDAFYNHRMYDSAAEWYSFHVPSYFPHRYRIHNAIRWHIEIDEINLAPIIDDAEISLNGLLIRTF